MSISKDAILEISQVGNGFIVRPGGHNWFRDGGDQRWPGDGASYLVFRTMAELADFLNEHFTHRARGVADDPEDEVKKAA